MDEGRKESGMVLSSKREGLGIVTLNRPLKRNALSQDMIEELLTALGALSRDRLVRVIVLTSVAESPFCGTSFEFASSPPTWWAYADLE